MAGAQAGGWRLLNPGTDAATTRDMFILLSEAPSPRLEYVAGFLFNDLLGCGLRITQDRAEWEASALCHLNYTRENLPGSFRITPEGLLHETGLRSLKPSLADGAGLPILFPTGGGDLPFDILSATFYLLSRYEEYLPHRKDPYGRYDHRESLAWTGGFLDRPMVDVWVDALRQDLQKRFNGVRFPERSFRFRPTYDIDIAWAHLNRPFLRLFPGAVMALLKGRPGDTLDRFATLLGMRPDPFDAYGWLDDLHERYPTEALYFFLVAEAPGRFDRNIDPGHPSMRALVSRHARRYRVGLHPSWASGDDPGRLTCESETLSEISSCGLPRHSRQHYLRFTLPATYRELIRAGVTDDHSMGYGSVNGFRASTCTPFRWYDLEKERSTPLMVHPFCFMDATAHHELGMDPAAALASLLRYLGEVRQVGGVMETVFHNSMLGTHRMYRGWRETYAAFLDVIG
jgi:hypothetical protein